MFGVDSFMQSGKYPLSSFANLHQFVGMKYDEEAIAALKKN